MRGQAGLWRGAVCGPEKAMRFTQTTEQLPRDATGGGGIGGRFLEHGSEGTVGRLEMQELS